MRAGSIFKCNEDTKAMVSGGWNGPLFMQLSLDERRIIARMHEKKISQAEIGRRKSRYTVLFRNNDRRSKPIMNQLVRHLAPLRLQARQSLTFDRGLEFVAWRELEDGMGTKAWFCDPQLE